nr:fatty acid desaturase [Rhizobiaceae bacterium]
GHPTRIGWLNELFVSLPLPLATPPRRFKALHLRHHCDERLTDPYDDPESYYLAEKDWNALSAPMRALLTANNTLLGRMILGPALMVFGFWRAEMKLVWANVKGLRDAWVRHAIGLAALVLIVTQGFGIPLWQYMLAAYGGLSLIAIRTFCEHRWAEDPKGRTIIVERAPLLSLLFLNNNLHLVHHTFPNVAWYRLPALLDARRDEWKTMNGGYVFASYREIFARWALKAKEPVTHPALRREALAGRAFHPRMRAATAGPANSCGVPAQKQDD